TPGVINPRPGWVSPTLLALGLASLAAAFVYGLRATSRTLAWRGLTGFLLCVAVAGQVGLSLRYGTWVQPAKPQKTLAEMDADKRRDFRLVALPGAGMESVAVVEQMERSILEPRLARFYRKVIRVGDVEAAWSVLGSTRRPDEAVVVGLAADDLPPASAAVRAADEIQLVRGTFNEIDLVVTAQAPGLLAFNYPYTERLRALVNGAPVPVYRANGNESAVRLPAGRHAVALRYASPATTAGVLISAATLAAMGLLAAMLGLQGRARVPAAAAALLLPAAAAVWWYQSLYAGAPMPADYYWTSTYLPNVENLAYGKRARASSTIDDQFPYYYYAGRAVDGRNDEMGFLTAIGEPNPWWEVDLGASHLISRIQLHDMGLVSKHFPLGIWLSADGQNFQRAAILDSPQQAGVWIVPIDNLPARFVRVQSPRNGPLGVAEIQVFGAPAP
ncbi:MAG: hypothetical protein OEW88_05825, partial [Gammaproteobacteria bacterium]|nr:hypothetical protein [Gammaproteobacteria bacterium]